MQITALLMLASSKRLAVVFSRLGELQRWHRIRLDISAKDPLVILMSGTFFVLYVGGLVKDIGDVYVEASSGKATWVYRLPVIGSWVCGGFTMLSVPATLSLVIKYLSHAMRYVVPPWAQLLLEQRDSEILKPRICVSPDKVYMTSPLELHNATSSQALQPFRTDQPALCLTSTRLSRRKTHARHRKTLPFLAWPKPAKSPSTKHNSFPPAKPQMDSFFSEMQVFLIQIDETFYMFADYIGPVLLVWTLLTATTFTFALYFSVDAALKGQAVWNHCILATVVFLIFLLINVSADSINQEVSV